jgi:multiple sugar transport system ATP-binding protein
VAIGRAIVKQPKAFLFDEPLSNLDAALRARTRLELARLHQQLRATMIFVTHDQVEAMTMASRIVVMNAGRVEQAGSPLEIYRRPASRFVATFIGTPAMNILPAARAADSGGFLAVRLADGTTIDTRIPAGTLADGDGIEIGIRAEHIGRGGPVPAVVDVVEHLGDRTLAYARTPQDATLVFEEPGDSAIAVGDRIGLTMPAQAIQVFDRAGRAHHPA